jgi:hypothetical protein
VWATSYRGPIAIHAGRSLDLHAAPWVIDSVRESMIYGAVVGVVDLVDIIANSTSKWALQGFHHWVISSPRRLIQPVPLSGRQGLFRLPENVCEEIQRQM